MKVMRPWLVAPRTIEYREQEINLTPDTVLGRPQLLGYDGERDEATDDEDDLGQAIVAHVPDHRFLAHP